VSHTAFRGEPPWNRGAARLGSLQLPSANRTCKAAPGWPLASRRASPSSRRAPRGGSLLVRASWGADVQFTPAKVLEAQPAATQLHRILVDLGALGEGYTQPGQFVQIKV
jgi:hypothetical protein